MTQDEEDGQAVEEILDRALELAPMRGRLVEAGDEVARAVVEHHRRGRERSCCSSRCRLGGRDLLAQLLRLIVEPARSSVERSRRGAAAASIRRELGLSSAMLRPARADRAAGVGAGDLAFGQHAVGAGRRRRRPRGRMAGDRRIELEREHRLDVVGR